MRSEIRSEAISLILGDLREFQDCTGQLHLSGLQTQETMTRLFEALEKRVANNLKSKEQEEVKKEDQEKFIKSESIFHLLSVCVESEYIINMFSDYKWSVVRQEMWDDWLKSCWGHDHDTLSMLSLLPPITRYNKFIESVEKLPIIQSPAPGSPKQQLENLVDYRTHSGALYPPSLQWAQWINTGIHYKTFILQKYYSPRNLNGYALSNDKIEEHRKRSQLSHGYQRVARVLLGAMLDFHELSTCSDRSISLDNDVKNHYLDNDVNNCSNLMEKVSDIVYKDNSKREELESLIKKYLPELNKSSSKWLAKSIKSGNFQKKVYSFLEEERKCIAYLLWKAKNKQLGFFIQEVLFAYLRCKGAWFQLNSGKNLEKLNSSEYVLLKIYDLLIVDSDDQDCDSFHEPMSHAVRQFYRDTNFPTKVELRLPFMGNRRDVKNNIDWLKSIYEQVQCDFVLSFPKHNFDEENQEKDYDNYINYVNELKKNFKICGFYLIGNHEIIDSDKYANFIHSLRNKIISKTGNNSCFVTYHLDEENNAFTLKKICEILTIVKMNGLKKGDRISHGWSLPSEADISNHKDGKEEMYREEWYLIETRLDELRDRLNDEQKKAVEQLKESAKYNGDKAYLDARVMCALATSLQPLVQEQLIKNEISLEICPTSSWRITGISLPTEHPVKSWIEAGGEVRVGTDNPAVFPCTIESEYYTLELIKAQLKKSKNQSEMQGVDLDMSEVTSHPSFEPQSENPDVFLAHNSDDKKQVQAIAGALEQRSLKPWLDSDAIQPGRLFQDEIQKAISSVKSAAIFIGLQGLGRWQKFELMALISQCVKRKIPVIPILLPGVTGLPEDLLFLEQFSWVSFSNEINDKNALDRLEWGITGKKQNIIQQEEKPGRVPTQEDIQTISPSANEVSQETSSEQNNYKWDVFLSHSSADKDKVREVPREGSCSCVHKLGQMKSTDLSNLMSQRLNREQIEIIFRHTLDKNMNDDIPNHNKEKSAIYLVDEAKNRRRTNELIKQLCERYPDIESP
ncbi:MULTISPECIES: toll/interleukin-1 receptor domain-containing protein [Nostoc]|uniref:TIR domain-containing protein n=2 Tax=Nostoc TaxID=1177 RepID=A0ABR8IAJ0_9NOSO|nr:MULTISPECIES: toll/interleukin-1 receptor domain-containing protein [Nostoc]MBD2564258.1 TIR domain-containing protein [Nostoc linckia FACHB-391]MBD2648073.1 TIR domain-containing protein [Nostoc foliaceum FACHB-393]